MIKKNVLALICVPFLLVGCKSEKLDCASNDVQSTLFSVITQHNLQAHMFDAASLNTLIRQTVEEEQKMEAYTAQIKKLQQEGIPLSQKQSAAREACASLFLQSPVIIDFYTRYEDKVNEINNLMENQPTTGYPYDKFQGMTAQQITDYRRALDEQRRQHSIEWNAKIQPMIEESKRMEQALIDSNTYAEQTCANYGRDLSHLKLVISDFKDEIDSFITEHYVPIEMAFEKLSADINNVKKEQQDARNRRAEDLMNSVNRSVSTATYELSNVTSRDHKDFNNVVFCSGRLTANFEGYGSSYLQVEYEAEKSSSGDTIVSVKRFGNRVFR